MDVSSEWKSAVCGRSDRHARVSAGRFARIHISAAVDRFILVVWRPQVIARFNRRLEANFPLSFAAQARSKETIPELGESNVAGCFAV